MLDKKQNLIGRGARGYEILDAQKQVIGHLKLDGSVVNIKNVEIGKLQPDGRVMDAGGRVIAVAEKLQYYQKPVEPETENGTEPAVESKGEETENKTSAEDAREQNKTDKTAESGDAQSGISTEEENIPELTEEEIKRQEFLKKERIRSRERYQKLKSGERSVGVPVTLTCKCCGQEFASKRTNTLFCGPNCRSKFYRQEAAESRSRACTCENCGKEFITTRSDVKYCSDDCRYAAQIKRQGARKKAVR